MEARTEAKENNNGGFGVCDHGVDDLFDHCHGEDGAQSMGSLQHTWHFKGKEIRSGCFVALLNVLQSSSEKQIKRRYKDLSLIYHPDKARPDESKNQTLDTVNDYWVDLSKAYKALTDEEVRNNFIKFGHPDGRQSFSIGIALPKFIITDGNGKYVLLVYGLLLGVLLPYVVGKWWYGTQRMTREKVLIASAGKLFREYTEEMDDGDVVHALSCAEEFQEVLKGSEGDSGTGKIEQVVAEETDLGPNGAGFTKNDLTKLKALDGVRRKVVALLWAYLGRKRVDGSTLDDGEHFHNHS